MTRNFGLHRREIAAPRWRVAPQLALVAVICAALALAWMAAAAEPEKPATEYTFMIIGVRNGENGQMMTEKFFLGRMPSVGEAVEMVYVGRDKDGNMRLQLRVKE